jgi:hypothetical protein
LITELAWGSARCGARSAHIALGPVGLGQRRRPIPLGEILILAYVKPQPSMAAGKEYMIKRKKYILETKMKDYELFKIIDQNRQSDIGLFHGKEHEYFKGQTYGKKFQIQRIVDGRNSFVPIIEGVIEQENEKCVIECVFRPYSFVKAFAIFAFIFIACMLTVLIIGLVNKTTKENIFVFFIFAMISVLSLGLFSFYDSETSKDLSKLKELFKVESTKEVK